MNESKVKKISKSLSYWLRHNPEQIGIELSKDGWTNINTLIKNAKSHVDFDFDELKYVVDNNDKKRFSISEDLVMIRASQGHSIAVDINFEEVIPPHILYHGAPVGVVDLIMKDGLKKMSRNHVHLSFDKDTAAVVGSRRGNFTILEVEAMKMKADGYKIYRSDNGVYLVEEVPAKYIKKQE